MAWWWAFEHHNPRSGLAAHSEADLMQGRGPQHRPALPLPDTARPQLSSQLILLSGFSWLILLQSCLFINCRAQRSCISWGWLLNWFCSSLSAGCSWHIMTFSLEFSWITWIPLPPWSRPRASCHPGFLAPLVMKHFDTQPCQPCQPCQPSGQNSATPGCCSVHCSHPPPPPRVFLLSNDEPDNCCYLSSLFK